MKMKLELKLLLVLLLGSVLIMTAGPFTVHEHYIYGLLAILMVMLIYLPPVLSMVLTLGVCLFWIMNLEYGKAAVPTTDRLACIQVVCDRYPQPIYVVTNSGSHDHQGLGYAYLAQQMGCDLYAVTQWKDQKPETMVVMNENAKFDFMGTDFYELNQFGERTFVTEEKCGPNLTATMFSN